MERMVRSSPPVPGSVRLAPGVEAALLEAFARAEGHEPCGYLLGRHGLSGAIEVHAIEIGDNEHPRPGRGWRLAPSEQLRVGRRARVRGLEVLGYWHGHRVGPPEPSREDHAGRAAVGRDVHVIVGREGGADVVVRAWRARPEGFEALALEGVTSRLPR